MIELSIRARSLDGISLGSDVGAVLARSEYVEDAEDRSDDDARDFHRFWPDASVTVVGGVVVTVGAYDECYLDGVDLIGKETSFVAALLGEQLVQTDAGAVNIYKAGDAIELYERDGVVVQVHLSDWDLVKD